MPLHTTRESRPTASCVSRRREEAVQGKGQASLCRPTSILERTRRCTPHGRSPGGPACPEDSGRIGHQRPPPAGNYDGMVEYSRMRPVPQPIVPIFHCSIIPTLLSSSAGGRLCKDFRPRRASRRSSTRTEPTGPKPTHPEKKRARLATALNRLFFFGSGLGDLEGRTSAGHRRSPPGAIRLLSPLGSDVGPQDGTVVIWQPPKICANREIAASSRLRGNDNAALLVMT